MIDMQSYDLVTTVREQLFANTGRATWILPNFLNFSDFKKAPHDVLIPFDFNNNALIFKTDAKFGSYLTGRIEFFTPLRGFVNLKYVSFIEITFDLPKPIIRMFLKSCRPEKYQIAKNLLEWTKITEWKIEMDSNPSNPNLRAFVNGEEIFFRRMSNIDEKKEDSEEKCDMTGTWLEKNIVWIKFVSPEDPSMKSAISMFRSEIREYKDCQTAGIGSGMMQYWKTFCIFDDITWYKCMLSDEYYGIVSSGNNNFCEQIAVDRVCENEPPYFQACGIDGCEGFTTHRGSELLCGTFICEGAVKMGMTIPQFGSQVLQFIDCNDRYDCKNTILDEAFCDTDITELISAEERLLIDSTGSIDIYTCSFQTIGPRTVQGKILTSKLCDFKCDCPLCDDEGHCNGFTYGLKCEVKNTRGSKVIKEFLYANSICDGEVECYEGEDERCDPKEVVRQCMNGDIIRNIYPSQICAVPVTPENPNPICTDGREQLNCYEESRIGLSCPIKDEEAFVSKLAICMGYQQCDDGYDDACFSAEGGCFIHKTELCNNFEDCPGGGDEKATVCRKLFDSTCVRRFPYKSSKLLKIPAKWVVDGTVDCVDGKDENVNSWDKCGLEEDLIRYGEIGTICEEVYLCGQVGQVKFIQSFEMCDRINTCGRENDVCLESRNQATTMNNVLKYETSHKVLLHCIKGLEYLQMDVSSCQKRLPFNQDCPSRSVLASTTYLDLPIAPVDCTYTFGEALVYLSCSDRCINTECVLKPIERDSCVNVQKSYAMAKNAKLSLMVKMSGNRYGDDLFPCDNNECVPYDKVCNLVNDCGDESDEQDCGNNFYCPVHKEHIPLSSKCDGFEDCRDFEDECNPDCSKGKRIIESYALRMSAWSLGASAVAFNCVVMVTSFRNLLQTDLSNVAKNHALIATIGLSDTVVGCYLLVLASTDLYYRDSYCRNKYLWLSSKSCAALGVVNNMAYQLSLFSMCTLSILRVSTFGQMIQKRLDDGRFERLKVFATVATVFAMAIPCAVIPLVPAFEDFFVNGLYYHDHPIFTASVDKVTHFNILKAHFGRLHFRELSWKNIRMLVGEMFSNDYGGKFQIE